MLPNFIIIGARKAGTTFLYQSLRQHPEIYMSPIKEPSYFALGTGEQNIFLHATGKPMKQIQEVCFTFAEYEKQFEKCRDEKAIGDTSPIYLFAKGTAARIKERIPNAKIIAILRNPVDRAFSAFQTARRDGIEPIDDFGEALQAEETRITGRRSFYYLYTKGSMYYDQLKEYYDCFGEKHIKVFLYDDLIKDYKKLLADIFTFLEVDERFSPKHIMQYNKSGNPYNKFLHTILNMLYFKNGLIKHFPIRLRYSNTATTIKKWIIDRYNNNLNPIAMDSEVRKQLLDLFSQDIERLEGLLHRDLQMWLH